MLILCGTHGPFTLVIDFLIQDFNIQGTQLISCGMDHSLKMWRTDTEKINDAIKDSYIYNRSKSNK